MSEATSANVVLISGDDVATIAAAAENLVRQVAGESPDAFSLDVVHDQEGLSTAEVVRQVTCAVLTPPFMGGKKTVWLKNFEGFKAEGKTTSKTADAKAFHELVAAISTGIPADINLIMSGPGVDARKALYRACAKVGRVELHNTPSRRGGQGWETEVRDLLRSRGQDKGMVLPGDVLAALVDIVGTDTGRIDPELEKLRCYCGSGEAITLEAVQAVCTGEEEVLPWALTDAVGKGDLDLALQTVDAALRQSNRPEFTCRSLILRTSSYVRELIQVKVFMWQTRVRRANQLRAVLEKLAPEERALHVSRGLDFVTGHWYRAQVLAEQAARFSGSELIRALRTWRDANVACVSGAASERVVLEQALMDLIGMPAARRPHVRGRPS